MYFHLMGILSSESNNIVKSNCNDDVPWLPEVFL